MEKFLYFLVVSRENRFPHFFSSIVWARSEWASMQSHARSSGAFEALFQQARRGCRDSAGQLLQECRGYLLVIANHELDEKLRAKLGGSDVVQQTLMHAHRDFADFRGATAGELLAWLQAILTNQIAGARRHYLETAKRDIRREIAIAQQDNSSIHDVWLPSDLTSPSEHAMASEDRQCVESALARLSDKYRRVIELRNRDLLSFAQIGERFSISDEAARRLWARAVEALRREVIDPNRSEEVNGSTSR